ncbi:hypothetical protein BKA56DRAFT_729804 [Ilyonectria sp. MPI-CAGE-AT-0026]|nr:hypothetical protein BKA56DRAFT_729804 [Ilyonectria sp. MPI-CAGE-AT-0026]
MDSSRRILYAIVLAFTIPTFAHFLDPILTSAVIEARQALETPTPTPTHPRQYPRDEADNLSTYTVTYAPNSTCGYLSGSVQIPITCENKGICLWELEYFRFIACEIDKDTGLARTKCLQRDEALDPVLCDDVCVSNTYNLFCTNETEPYCRTYAYPKGVRDYRCAATPATRVSSVDFTYNGEQYPDFTVSTFVDVDGTTREPSESLSIATTTKDAGSLATSSSTTKPKDDGKGSTNVGAIAGGTIGGFFVGMFALGMVYWFRFRPRRNPDNTDAPASPSRQPFEHESSKDQPPQVVQERSPISPDLSPARTSLSYVAIRPITAPLPPSSPDQPEVVYELGGRYT